MSATQPVLDTLVIAQLMRLHNDKSLLEQLYEDLPKQSDKKAALQFLSLWTELEGRAARLECLLDEMESSRIAMRKTQSVVGTARKRALSV